MPFNLDPRLEQDSIFITDLPLCQVRLENVRNFPWLILVPRVDNLTEVHQLSVEQQAQLMDESSRCAQALNQCFALDKINVGALGNVVSQLHWHVVGRRTDDDAWPLFGLCFSPTDEWTTCEQTALQTQLQALLAS
ncbi:MAG: HIT domain-containing protein [Gammaproteobacteria bacterium]|nr:HIT domain-containing protein [Gammaproteobacteria bacterium]